MFDEFSVLVELQDAAVGAAVPLRDEDVAVGRDEHIVGLIEVADVIRSAWHAERHEELAVGAELEHLMTLGRTRGRTDRTSGAPSRSRDRGWERRGPTGGGWLRCHAASIWGCAARSSTSSTGTGRATCTARSPGATRPVGRWRAATTRRSRHVVGVVGDPHVAIPIDMDPVWRHDHARAEASDQFARGVEQQNGIDRGVGWTPAVPAASFRDPNRSAIFVDVDGADRAPRSTFRQLEVILNGPIGIRHVVGRIRRLRARCRRQRDRSRDQETLGLIPVHRHLFLLSPEPSAL